MLKSSQLYPFPKLLKRIFFLSINFDLRFLSDKEKYIENTFKLFQYPNNFLYNAKCKAYKIHWRKIEKSTDNKTPPPPKKRKFGLIILSTNSITGNMKNNLSNFHLKFINTTLKIIKDAISTKWNYNNKENRDRNLKSKWQ